MDRIFLVSINGPSYAAHSRVLAWDGPGCTEQAEEDVALIEEFVIDIVMENPLEFSIWEGDWKQPEGGVIRELTEEEWSNVKAGKMPWAPPTG